MSSVGNLKSKVDKWAVAPKLVWQCHLDPQTIDLHIWVLIVPLGLPMWACGWPSWTSERK